ncbi:MAG: S1C family serine protease [Candidatus Omnitrophota bacterium]
MRYSINLILIFIIISCLNQAWAADNITLYQELRDSIVTISGKTPSIIDGREAMLETSGAGAILDTYGVIATNTHVIYGATYIQVKLRTGETFSAQVLYISPTDDVSLLKIITSIPLKPVIWADSNLVQLNDEIITPGNSELLKSTISGGRIRAIGVHKNDPTQTPEFLELDINPYQGDSGGPVFTRRGEFIGLIHAKRLNENRACFVVPSNKIHFAYLNLANLPKNR